MNSLPGLPPPGRWAIGMEAQHYGEALLAAARAQGLRTAWLGAEAGFLSNLSVLENLRLMHDWHRGHPAAFAADLLAALDVMELDMPDWLQMRPSQLLDSQLIRARVLRVLLLRADVAVLSPVTLGLAGDTLASRLLAQFDGARIFLLDQAQPNWPAWPAHDTLASSPGEISS
ncbi:MAG: hypothetical protein ACRERR_09650 [Moraxellaceae bacterium]